jgi:hypothetical protein
LNEPRYSAEANPNSKGHREYPIHQQHSWLRPGHSAPVEHRPDGALTLGALALLGTGVDHIQQYYGGDYSSVPTIGTLFFLNFVSAVVVTAGLVAPLGRIAGHYAGTIRDVFAVCGIGIAVGSLAGLFVSESSGLFGFVEHGYRTPITLAIVAEVAATFFLTVFLAAHGKAGARRAPACPGCCRVFYRFLLCRSMRRSKRLSSADARRRLDRAPREKRPRPSAIRRTVIQEGFDWPRSIRASMSTGIEKCASFGN